MIQIKVENYLYNKDLLNWIEIDSFYFKNINIYKLKGYEISVYFKGSFISKVTTIVEQSPDIPENIVKNLLSNRRRFKKTIEKCNFVLLNIPIKNLTFRESDNIKDYLGIEILPEGKIYIIKDKNFLFHINPELTVKEIFNLLNKKITKINNLIKNMETF